MDLMDSDPQHVVALAQVLCVVACMVVVGLDSMSSQERTLSETQDKNLSNSTSWCPSNSSAHLDSVEEGMPMESMGELTTLHKYIMKEILNLVKYLSSTRTKDNPQLIRRIPVAGGNTEEGAV